MSSSQSAVSVRCPGCASPVEGSFYAVAATPVTCTSIFDSAPEARAVPLGGVTLTVCGHCGLIFNTAFDPSRAELGARYESSQAASAHFSQFARSLSAAWVQRHGLVGKCVLEVGCGGGEFLQQLLRDGVATAIGVDPLAPDSSSDPRLRFRRTTFDGEALEIDADALVCRHTLEHVHDVGEFIGKVARWAAHVPGRVVLFELPATERLLEECAFWDVYYEHCNYFTAASLAFAFEAAGFEVLRQEHTYGDQYLLLEARMRSGAPVSSARDFGELQRRCARFGERAREAIGHCDASLRAMAASGAPIVVWQGAAKTVGFIAALQEAGRIRSAVDLGPGRHGRFLPASAMRVDAPNALRSIAPGYVVLMNPVYLEEVRAHLAELGVNATLLTVNDLVAGLPIAPIDAAQHATR